MITLSVDDSPSVTVIMTALMNRIDPGGTHLSASSAAEAFEILSAQKADVVFLDVEMPGMNGIEAAQRIRDDFPETNVIFITGYKEYAYEAYQVFASGFLCKPVREKDVRTALENLRYPLKKEEVPETQPGKLRVQCFGSFGVFSGGDQVVFSRAKTLELFAYLVFRRGVMCTNGELVGILWGDEPADDNKFSYLRKLIKDLRDTLRAIGAEDVIKKEWNCIGVHTDKIECDYYNYLSGSSDKNDQYRGSFMSQFSWAEETVGYFS